MNPRIVIIGAGAAGISTATRLYEKGYKNFLILEAEKRIGGRIHSIPFASNVVDLGAQWCHGEKGNIVNELGKKFQVFDSTTTKYDRFSLVQSNGQTVPMEESDKLMKLVISIVESYKDELSKFKGSLGSFIVDKFTEHLQTPEYENLDKNIAGQFLEFFHKYENSIEASDTWYDTSGSGYLHYWDCEGDRLLNWKEKGYKTVFDLMLKRYPHPNENSINLDDKILFSKIVKNISWHQNVDDSVIISCQDNSSYIADHVIVTVALGFLKENYQTFFTPALPVSKKNAIQGLGFGTVNKFYLEFEKPFWPKDWQGFSLLWTKDDLDDVRSMKENWMEDVFGFYIVDYQPNILCGWISGKKARQMEKTDEVEVKKSCMFLLRKFLKSMEIPEPINFHRTTWYKNKNCRGSYSFRSVSTDLLNTSASDLAKPLTDSLGTPIVLFAGEATHDHFYSTVHGAIETGRREADRIAKIYEIQEKFDNAEKCYVDVLVLGAGVAGLGAATILKDKRLSFAVLEAQNRAGGRVHTKNMINSKTGMENPEVFIEAGAQWLHGKQNMLHEIAQKNDLLINELSEEGLGVYIRDDSFVYDEFLVKKVDFIVGQILEECERFTQENGESHPESVETFLRQEFEIRIKNFEYKEKILAKQILDWHNRFQIIDNSCLSMTDVSAKLWGMYSFNGESCQAHINTKKGFSAIVDAIVDDVGRDKIIFEKIVKEIDLNEADKIVVHCADGSIYNAKHVIVTFSLGVLKKSINSLFNPQLPIEYVKGIQNIGFGAIGKIFIQFSYPWWGSWEGIQLLWRDEKYDNSHWTRYMSGFDIVNPGPKNTLLCWVGGQGVIDMEKLSDNEIIKDCLEVLRKFTGLGVPEPINHYCSRWNSNEFVRGAYSFTSNKCDKEPSSWSIFADPILNGTSKLLFAGEAFHQKYFSTVHGAFLSGIEQADKLFN